MNEALYRIEQKKLGTTEKKKTEGNHLEYEFQRQGRRRALQEDDNRRERKPKLKTKK